LSARFIKLVAGHEVEPIIEPVNRCRHAGHQRRRLYHHQPGKAAVTVALLTPRLTPI